MISKPEGGCKKGIEGKGDREAGKQSSWLVRRRRQVNQAAEEDGDKFKKTFSSVGA